MQIYLSFHTKELQNTILLTISRGIYFILFPPVLSVVFTWAVTLCQLR